MSLANTAALDINTDAHPPSVLAPVIHGALPPSLQRLDKILVRACASELPGIAESVCDDTIAAIHAAAGNTNPSPLDIAHAAGKTDQLIAVLTAAYYFTSDPYWLHVRDIWQRAAAKQRVALAEATFDEDLAALPTDNPAPALPPDSNRARQHLRDAVSTAARGRITNTATRS